LDLDDDFPCDFGECNDSDEEDDDEFIPEIEKLIPIIEQLVNPRVCTNDKLKELCKSLGLPHSGPKLILFEW
jgi:hypothetical protein